MTTVEMRDYQSAAVDAVFDYWGEGGGNPLVVLATGLGKSVVFGEIARRVLTDYPTMRVLLLTHVQELVEQDFKALLRVWPDAPAGIYSAGLGMRQTRHRITCASIQSVYRKARELGPRHLVIIDEAHLVPAKGAGMYRSLLDDLRMEEPDLRVLGLTATPFRLDSGRLDKGADKIFDQVVYEYGVGEGIADGWLSPLRSRAGEVEIDVSGVTKRGGEFVAESLEVAANDASLITRACAEIVRRGVDRRSWLVFCAGVDNAFRVRDELRRLGVCAETVTGDTPKDERRRIVADFKAGRIRALTNAQVLTTGFDAPSTDLIAFLRPTLSTGLYVQMIGRGTRKAEGKADCIAEGQRVLTDIGLVPIEQVTREMKVWDGVAFVEHGGAVCMGERDVITYAGLTATPDHRVWTKEGWKTLGQCAVEQAPIVVTGDGRKAVRAACGRVRGGVSRGQNEPGVHRSAMRRVRINRASVLFQSRGGHGRLQAVRKSTSHSEVAAHAGDLCQAALHQSERRSVRALWWKGDRVSLLQPNSNGAVDHREHRPPSRPGDRPDRQRRALRAGEPSLVDRIAEPRAHAQDAGLAKGASVPSAAPGNSVRRRDAAQSDQRGALVRRDRRALPPTVQQAKRRVWDILNAGPLHRFTVEGLLVHNCLVLDFSGNVRRHGPVDLVRGRDRKEKGPGEEPTKAGVDDVRAKECPECATLAHLGAKSCEACGYTWPEKPKHEAQPDEDTPILSSERKRRTDGLAPDMWRASVHAWSMHHHASRDGRPPTVRVEYLADQVLRKEWLCPQHSGFPRSKFERWWREHTQHHGRGGTIIPDTVAEVLQRAGELRRPETIILRKPDKYVEIVSRTFSEEEGAKPNPPAVPSTPEEVWSWAAAS